MNPMGGIPIQTNSLEGAQRKCLLGILSLGLLLNVWGVTWGLPERWHPDELTQRAENMVGEPSLNPHYFAYGGLHYYLIAAFAVLPVKIPNKMLNVMDYDAQSTVVVALSRLLSALLGTGVVYLTFWIGSRLFDRWTGLLASAFLATSMVLVNLSHFATADVPSVFWFMLSCAMATDVLRRGAARSYVLAGLCAGLAAAVKYVGGLSLIALFAAHLLGKRASHKMLVVAFVMAAAGFILGNPVLLFAPLEFADGFVAESVFNSLRGFGLPRAFVPLIFQLKDALGAPVFLLSLAGLAYGVRLSASKENRASVLLVLSMMLPYYCVIGAMRGPRAGPLLLPLPPLRYTLPMLPFLLLFPAKMLGDLLVSPRRHVRGFSLTLLGVSICYSIVYAVSVDLKFTNDSRYAAGDWLLRNLRAGATIETTSYGPTIPHDKYVVVERPHNSQVADVAAFVSQSGRYLRFQTMIAKLEVWVERAGLRSRSEDYVPWYRKALLRYDQETSTFDSTIQGLESRAPDVLVASDLYFVRFQDGSSADGRFFRDLLSGKSSYKRVATFHYELPSWTDPPAEFVNPTIYVYSQGPSDRE